MDFAALTAAARCWIETDPAFPQIVRGYFNGSVYRPAQKVRRRNSEFPINAGLENQAAEIKKRKFISEQ